MATKKKLTVQAVIERMQDGEVFVDQEKTKYRVKNNRIEASTYCDWEDDYGDFNEITLDDTFYASDTVFKEYKGSDVDVESVLSEKIRDAVDSVDTYVLCDDAKKAMKQVLAVFAKEFGLN